MDTKTCRSCGETLPVERFYLTHKGGTARQSTCIDCKRVVMRHYMRGRPVPKEERTRKRVKKYGMTPDQFYNMVAEQGGCCAICNKQVGAELFVDHCHNSNKVRGLLCLNCNSLLGHAKDSADFLMSAAIYLRESGTCRSKAA